MYFLGLNIISNVWLVFGIPNERIPFYLVAGIVVSVNDMCTYTYIYLTYFGYLPVHERI